MHVVAGRLVLATALHLRVAQQGTLTASFPLNSHLSRGADPPQLHPDRLPAMDLLAALTRRDFAACGALLQASRLPAEAAAQWRAWLLLHGGDAEGAAAAFAALGPGFALHRAGCLFALHRHREAQELALQVGMESAGCFW